MNKTSTDILIVGAGPAGLAAAAAAANSGGTVTLIDENPRAGGQIWRAELGKIRSPAASKFLRALTQGRVDLINSATVFAFSGDNTLTAQTPGGSISISCGKMILAAGARERFLPFPGWTLPGVFGAGGLQALVKGGLSIENKRIVVAGSGPLLLAVADYLKTHGATVLVIAEQASAAKIRRFARGLWRQPEKMVQAAALRARLIGIPYKPDTWITRCRGPRVSKRLARELEVTIKSRGSSRVIECDYVACGFHLVPNLELPMLLGCQIRDGSVSVGDHQQTSVRDVYCAGELTGIAGIESSLIEGEIAGLAASGQTEKAKTLIKKRDAATGFGRALDHTFALRPELKHLVEDDTLICRCEDVSYAQVKDFATFREAKLQTRCGMGPCQGRVCGPAVEYLLGWEPASVRPPIFPVKMKYL
ncbi:MAG: NAD(P)/FAD-dependent oxidoreductase [Acidobacteria bacterium]|nr:NAD(P)/FAD-dependent oxidoreductase [Acidobacteriota bacterium]